MRPERLSAMVCDVPSALIACRANGEEARIAAISPCALDLRAAQAFDANARFALSFLRPQTGDYFSLPIQNVRGGSVWREDGATLTRLLFDDLACAAAIRRSLNDYARYVELRGECGAGAYGAQLTGYPVDAEADFPPSPEAQRDEWFASLAPLPEPIGRELALSLHSPELWDLYLSAPIDDLLDVYARLCHAPRRLLPQDAPSRLYLGNPCCRHLFPDNETLRRLLQKAEREGVRLTLVTAELRSGSEARLDEILRTAAAIGAECEINDWGALMRAQDLPVRPALTLGTRLNRRRKDPRMVWMAGFAQHAALLEENALNAPAFRARLNDLGVARVECELCGYEVSPPEGARSLHLPFYLTNAAMWCPLRALCARGSRGAQSGGARCERWCARNTLLYPSQLNLLSRFNALYGLDRRPWNAAYMDLFDRWVLNF